MAGLLVSTLPDGGPRLVEPMDPHPFHLTSTHSSTICTSEAQAQAKVSGCRGDLSITDMLTSEAWGRDRRGRWRPEEPPWLHGAVTGAPV
jgi:hypothetical protein